MTAPTPGEIWIARQVLGRCIRARCDATVAKLFSAELPRGAGFTVYGLCDDHVCSRCGAPAAHTVTAWTAPTLAAEGEGDAAKVRVGACVACLPFVNTARAQAAARRAKPTPPGT